MQDQSGQAAGPARASGPPPPGAGTAARRERWARLRRTLWQPPRPHGEQPREREVGPLELFYDLAVVVLAAQTRPAAADAAAAAPGPAGWRALRRGEGLARGSGR
jgi:hypothetical protein